jgi:outer membrane protein OmpA-like peptidoglycan-associated protein
MKGRILSLATVFISLVTFGQGNMIQNGSFEDVSKKVKEAGSIELATGWTSATESKADLFTASSKSDEYKTPINVYGDGDPKDGENYAGLMMYSYKDESPRQYLQAQLNERMTEEKVYCVKMNVMLALMAKYSSNNIGIFISKKPLTGEEIAYIAEGGEEYITIGNFGSFDATLNEKVKKPKGFTGSQARGAYYYIDDVSVMNMAGVESCDCELDAGGKSLNVVYSVETSTEMEMDVSQEIERSRIYFDDGSDVISALALNDINKVANLLKEHPKYKVKVVGHTDPVEEAKSTGNVSMNRATAVKAKLVELGVADNKLLVVEMKDFEPVTKDATVAGQAQNRRVVFSVVSKE